MSILHITTGHQHHSLVPQLFFVKLRSAIRNNLLLASITGRTSSCLAKRLPPCSAEISYFRAHQLQAFAFSWQITNVTMTTWWVNDRSPANYKGWILKYLGQQSEEKCNAKKPSSYIHNKNQITQDFTERPPNLHNVYFRSVFLCTSLIHWILKENVCLPLNTTFFISHPGKDTRPRTRYPKLYKCTVTSNKAQRFSVETKRQRAWDASHEGSRKHLSCLHRVQQPDTTQTPVWSP